MNIFDFYHSLGNSDAIGQKIRQVIYQAHWYSINMDFDPKTSTPLPQRLSCFLHRVGTPMSTTTLHDRLWRITEHARPSIERLFLMLNESPRREQALLPIRSVRELDTNSFIKLSNRPGRNIREKLAGKPYLQAVRRFQSIDLPENRLLKAFVVILADLLDLRQDCFGEEDALSLQIQSWLRSDEALSIGHWDNPPPNNTLLSHRDYRHIWDAWRWLQTLDVDLERDLSQIDSRDQTMCNWNKYGKMYKECKHLFAEVPIFFDYEDFKIQPWSGNAIIKKTESAISRKSLTPEIFDFVCVDLASVRPYYSNIQGNGVAENVIALNFIWQKWQNKEIFADIELFDADAAYIHPDVTTISSTDLFLSKNNTFENLDSAAHAFATKLRECFKAENFFWLIPDFLNDFELEITRRNINACFPNAEPLPRSIATVFEQIDYSKITDDGFPVVVVDIIGGKTCATKLIARFDSELKKKIPETFGYYWERCPAVILVDGDYNANYDIITVDEHNQWHDREAIEKPQFIDQATLKRNGQIGNFAFFINIIRSPVKGGIRLQQLQKKAGDIPLWRDQIPELSLEVNQSVNGISIKRKLQLVGKNTTIRPVRGAKTLIPIEEDFDIPAGEVKPFPLFIGENAAELGYSARLDSPALPLREPTKCKLKLTFEYGANEPYELFFIPIDKFIPPFRVKWEKTKEKNITDAPAPEYPAPLSWANLQEMPKPDTTETSNFLDWALRAVDDLDHGLFIYPKPRETGKISRDWGVDKNGDHITNAVCDKADRVFIHEKSLIDGITYENFKIGDEISFKLLQQYDGRYKGEKVAHPDYEEQVRLRSFNEPDTKAFIAKFRKRLYVPFIYIWNNGHSITDSECPPDFARNAKEKIQYISNLLMQDAIPDSMKHECLFLLSCTHKDSTKAFIQWITERIEKGFCDSRIVAFSLGDVSEAWQQYIFSKLACSSNKFVIEVFAVSIWREEHFIEKFSIFELHLMLDTTLQLFQKTNTQTIRFIEKPLELLLGLLRTRASIDPEIKMLLQPHQKITKEFAKQIERITEIIAKGNIKLFSRVQLNLQKPEGDKTPDLLYALRLYLTGDDSANAIHIAGIADED